MLIIYVNFLLDVSYSSDYFEETTNVQNFGVDSLWANIGGYVSMLLGIAFFQVPDVVLFIYRYVQKKKEALKEKRYLTIRSLVPALQRNTKIGQDSTETQK